MPESSRPRSPKLVMASDALGGVPRKRYRYREGLCTEPGPFISRSEYHGEDPFPPTWENPCYEDAEDRARYRPCPLPDGPVSPPRPFNEWHEIEKGQTSDQSPILMEELERILNEMHEQRDDFTWRIPKYLVIAFVEAVLEAHQYFDLKRYLRTEYQHTQAYKGQDKLNKPIVSQLKMMKTFDKIDKEAILYAVMVRFSELKGEIETQRYVDYLTLLVKTDFKRVSKFSEIECDMQKKFPGLKCDDLEDGFEWYRSCVYLYDTKVEELCLKQIETVRQTRLDWLRMEQDNDRYLSLRPIYALVLRSREKVYAMDQNPEIELAKIIFHDDWFCYNFLKDGPLENLLFQARTVLIENVPCNASEGDIRQLFSCEDIEYIEMESGDESQTASITFANSQGTESALVMRAPALLGQPVIIKPRLGFVQRQAVTAYLLSKADRKINAAAENARLAKALIEYKRLIGSQIELQDEFLQNDLVKLPCPKSLVDQVAQPIAKLC